MQNKGIERFIIGVVVLTALIFLVLWQVTASVCAHETDESCTPTLPIPSYEYLPNITDTPTTSPNDATPTVSPQMDIPQPTLQPTSSAGSSAFVVMPSFAPDTGR